MISIEVNPTGIENDYLKCLNLAYGSWGNRERYDWYFRRKTAYPDTDLIVLRFGGELAAGTAVSYRTIALPNEGRLTAGIMSGSWTLPQFRGRGCFARLIEESLRLAKEKPAALLLGFVTHENASHRGFARAGAALFPASYLIAGDQTPVDETANATLKRETLSDEMARKIFERFNDERRGHCRFDYPTQDDFRAQFFDRPEPAELLTDNDGNCGVIEIRESVDVLQLCITAANDALLRAKFISQLRDHSARRGRKLRFYATESALSESGIKGGFEAKPGYIGVFSTRDNTLAETLEMPAPLETADSRLLAQAESPWFLGRWNLQSGDRL